MAARLIKIGASFAQNRNGTVAMTFGLMFMAFTMVAGVAIDMGRITYMKARIVSATDAAALAAGNALLDGRLSDSEIEQLAQDYFMANLSEGGELLGSLTPPAVTVDRAKGEVNIDVNGTIPMTITKIAGFNDVTVPVNSTTRFDQRDIELGMALDVTGSMRGTKLTDLKDAAKNLVDILMPDTGQLNKVRIGLAPYAASINAGSYASVVTGYSGGHNCVHERGGANAFTDAAPVGINKLGRKSSMSCPGVTVLPMTDNKGLLKSTIDSYSATGSTAGHIGAAWAWYLVSPLWDSIWPSVSKPVPYGSGNTLKVVILMTDGIFNTQYVGTNGNSSDQARSVCAAMKQKEVAVYAVAFQAPSEAQAILQQCASGTDFYFSADNGAELNLAFQKIAEKLNNLRLTN